MAVQKQQYSPTINGVSGRNLENLAAATIYAGIASVHTYQSEAIKSLRTVKRPVVGNKKLYQKKLGLSVRARMERITGDFIKRLDQVLDARYGRRVVEALAAEGLPTTLSVDFNWPDILARFTSAPVEFQDVSGDAPDVRVAKRIAREVFAEIQAVRTQLS